MSATEAQLAANRMNALLSTGPKTPEGKALAAQNSRKHGLAGPSVAQLERLLSAVPASITDQWLDELIVAETDRIAACNDDERGLRADQPRRARHNWEEDRLIEIDDDALRLRRHPSLVRRQIAATAPGCVWLIERWEMLLEKLDGAKDWAPEERVWALDLLGVPPDLRAGRTRLDGPNTDPDARAAHLVQLAQNEIARLRHKKAESLDWLDAMEREEVLNGERCRLTRGLIQTRRYAAAAHRRLQWAIVVKQQRAESVLREAEEAAHEAKEQARRDLRVLSNGGLNGVLELIKNAATAAAPDQSVPPPEPEPQPEPQPAPAAFEIDLTIEAEPSTTLEDLGVASRRRRRPDPTALLRALNKSRVA